LIRVILCDGLNFASFVTVSSGKVAQRASHAGFHCQQIKEFSAALSSFLFPCATEYFKLPVSKPIHYGDGCPCYVSVQFVIYCGLGV
jgi:hypothetical protein